MTSVNGATQRHVLLLAAHGSSTDSLVIERVHAHAQHVAGLVPHHEVRIGFARGTPSLRDVVSDLAGTGSTLTVVPFMTSAGYYAERVMPGLLRDSFGGADVRMTITRPIGASPRIASVLQRRALRVAAREGWNLSDTAVVIVGHGTPRHAASRDTALAHARALSLRGWANVQAAFIDDEPGIASVVASIAQRQMVVLPFLIGGARHAAFDVPHALGLAVDPLADDEHSRFATIDGRAMVLDEPLGVDAALAEIAADFAVRAWPAITRTNAPSRGARVRTGMVHLVGAGPGSAELLTVRARKLLRRADVVVHDRLVSDEVLALSRADARLVDVGKLPSTPQSSQNDINDCLIAFARDGKRVVRLKGGDPFVFGRGSEEVDACREAKVRVAVEPGLSSALVAPLVAGIPLTARGISRGFAVVTAATASDVDGDAMHVRDYANVDTVVVLMARARLGAVCAQLMAAGRDASTPVACIERATLQGERVVRGTLATIAHIANEQQLQSPMVTVIGETARAQSI